METFMAENPRRERILAAKEEFAALPPQRQAELQREFDEAQREARFQQEYRR